MDDSLRKAASEGNVSDLYTLIRADGNVLKRFDEVEFIETPLHIAAKAGCIKFAKEIMSLKPSFARKLNPQGLTPLHLAVEKEHQELVLLLLENGKDLVRIKGWNGKTPLHYLITREEDFQVQLLPRFLEVCLESVRDVTIENQTALHIAVTNKKEMALKILCKMLWKTSYLQDIVNQEDENGDTALHIAARSNQHKMIKLLLKCKADKHASNKLGFIALHDAEELNYRESISVLRGCCIPGVSSFLYRLQKQFVKYVEKASMLIFQDMDSIPMEDRNALLVILGLLLTATYQASLSPPGGVWQGGQNNGEKVEVGKSVMKPLKFLLFYIPASAVFIVTFFLMLGLLKPFPRGFRTALQVLLAFLAICFYQSISFLAPNFFATAVIDLFSVFLFVLMMFMCFAYRASKVSVLILGCWLYPTVFDLYNLYDFHHNPYFGLLIGNSIVGLLLFLFLYDEFLKGTVLVIGFCLVISLGYIHFSSGFHVEILSLIIVVLGCWFFLSLCRFCIKRGIQHFNNAYIALKVRDQRSFQFQAQLAEL